MKDFRYCGIEGSLGAHCNQFYTDAPVNYDKTNWDKLSFGWLCLSPDDYGVIKSELEQACSIANCTYEQWQTMDAAFRRIDNLNK